MLGIGHPELEHQFPPQPEQTQKRGWRAGGREGGRVTAQSARGFMASREGWRRGACTASLGALPGLSSGQFSLGLVGQLAHQVCSKGGPVVGGTVLRAAQHPPVREQSRSLAIAASNHPYSQVPRFPVAPGDGEFPLWSHKPKFKTSVHSPT